MDKTTTIFFIIIVILAIAGIAYGAYVYFVPTAFAPGQNQQTNNQTANQEDPYAGWKTYTNEKYEFSFRYPGDWHLVDYCRGGGMKIKMENQIRIYKNEAEPVCGDDLTGDFIVQFNQSTESLLSEEILIKNDDPKAIIIKEKILGEDALKYSYISSAFGVRVEGVFFVHDGITYQFFGNKDILSTFKFTK